MVLEKCLKIYWSVGVFFGVYIIIFSKLFVSFDKLLLGVLGFSDYLIIIRLIENCLK